METEPRGLAVNTFKEVLQGREVFFYVLRLQQSFLLWVGGSDGEMEALAVAMNTPHVCNKTLHIACLYFPMSISMVQDTQAVCSQLMGTTSDVMSSSLAKRLGIDYLSL